MAASGVEGALSLVSGAADSEYPCPYCGRSNGCRSFIFRAHRISPAHYEALMERGWCRSGTLLYLPRHPACCCPQFSMRIDVTRFRPTRHQQRVRDRFRRFLSGAYVPKLVAPQLPLQLQRAAPRDPAAAAVDDAALEEQVALQGFEPLDSEDEEAEFAHLKVGGADAPQPEPAAAVVASPSSPPVPAALAGAPNMRSSPPDSPPRVAAPAASLRSPSLAPLAPPLERVRRAVADALLAAMASLTPPSEQPKLARQPVEQLVRRERGGERGHFSSGAALHLGALLRQEGEGVRVIASKLANAVRAKVPELRAVEVAERGHINFFLGGELAEVFAEGEAKLGDARSPAHAARAPPAARKQQPPGFQVQWMPSVFSEEIYQLYARYQTVVHREPLHRATPVDFKSFLCDTPLGGTSFHRTYMLREPGNNEPRPLAVGMLDVLPRSISSNYFIWDPAYAALSLGVVSALDEIGYVASRAQREPHFRHYYIGYYVPNNQRMRYKLQYDAAELFCPIMKQWVPKDRAVEALRHSIYAPLTLRDGDAVPPGDPCARHTPEEAQQLIENLPLLVEGEIMVLEDLRIRAPELVSERLCHGLRTLVRAVGIEIAQELVYCV